MIAAQVLGLRLNSTGYGLHVTQLSDEQLRLTLTDIYAGLILSVFYITLPKYSILFFYARLFKKHSRSFSVSMYVMGAFVTAWMLYAISFLMVQCSPIRKNWLPGASGRCLHPYRWHLAVSIWCVIMDFFIMLLPLPTLWKLNTGRKRKLRLTVLFVCGYWYVIYIIGTSFSNGEETVL